MLYHILAPADGNRLHDGLEGARAPGSLLCRQEQQTGEAASLMLNMDPSEGPLRADGGLSMLIVAT